MEHLKTVIKGPTAPATPPLICVGWKSSTAEERLPSRWINAAQEPDALHADIKSVLDPLSPSGTVGWELLDSQGFGDWRPTNTCDYDTIAEVALRIMAHGTWFGRLMDRCKDLKKAVGYMEHGYRGQWESLGHFVADYLGSVCASQLKKLPATVRSHISHDEIAELFESRGNFFAIPTVGEFFQMVHVFERSCLEINGDDFLGMGS
jgi:hypothetical protein